MELYKYDFTYIVTVLNVRTIYYITDKPIEREVVVEYGTDASIQQGTELINQLSCMVEKQPTKTVIYVPNPMINNKSSFLSKEEIQTIQKQVRMILQAAHRADATEIAINVGGNVCFESVIRVIQMTLHEKNGLFTTITICCPNTKCRTTFRDVFRPSGILNESVN